MASNPLQHYFRQPKIYVGLPSKGVFNKLGSISGDASHMPVYSMTGMDEIIIKTPDALMSGESTVKVLQSCCPSIKDAWETSSMDIPLLLAAIRIATYGNDITVSHKCSSCNEIHDYELDLARLIEHYQGFKYDNSIRINDLTIRLQPLTYRDSTVFAIRNYALQKQLLQAQKIEDEEEQQTLVNTLFNQLGALQNEIFAASIESVQTSTETVSDRGYINEWITNCDKEVFDALKKKFEATKESLKPPLFNTECDSCGAANQVHFELDETNFFVTA